MAKRYPPSPAVTLRLFSLVVKIFANDYELSRRGGPAENEEIRAGSVVECVGLPRVDGAGDVTVTRGEVTEEPLSSGQFRA